MFTALLDINTSFGTFAPPLNITIFVNEDVYTNFYKQIKKLRSNNLAWCLVSTRTLKEMIRKHFDEDYLVPLPISANESVVVYIFELIWMRILQISICTE